MGSCGRPETACQPPLRRSTAKLQTVHVCRRRRRRVNVTLLPFLQVKLIKTQTERLQEHLQHFITNPNSDRRNNHGREIPSDKSEGAGGKNKKKKRQKVRE